MSKLLSPVSAGAPFRLSEKERSRLKKRERRRGRGSSVVRPDNPPLSEEQLKRMAPAREVRLIREKTGFEPTAVRGSFPPLDLPACATSSRRDRSRILSFVCFCGSLRILPRRIAWSELSSAKAPISVTGAHAGRK